MIQRTCGDIAQLMTNRGNAAGLICHQVLGIAQPFQRHYSWPATVAAAGTSRREPLVHALADQIAFHLGERCLDLEEGPAGRSGGVKRGLEGTETNASTLELVDKPDQLARTPSKPIEVQHDENIAAPEVIKTGRKPWTVSTRAACTVLKDPIAARRP